MTTITGDYLIKIMDSRYNDYGLFKMCEMVDKFPILKDIILEYIDKHPESINSLDHNGYSMLMILAMSLNDTSIELFKELLKRGADFNLDNMDETAIQIAMNYRNIDVIKTLIEMDGIEYHLSEIIYYACIDNGNMKTILDFIIEKHSLNQVMQSMPRNNTKHDDIIDYIVEGYRKKYIMEYNQSISKSARN